MAAAFVMEPESLGALLGQLLQHDSSQIKQAEATMRKALTKPLFICDLFEMIQLSPSAEIRQLAAVLVRRRIVALWSKLEAAVQQQLQAALLDRLQNDPEHAVRRSLASVASVIGRYALPKGTWPELFAFLTTCMSSATEAHRELAMMLLASLLESDVVVEKCLRPHFAHIRAALQHALGETSSRGLAVPRAALKAVAAWSQNMMDEEDTAELEPLLPAVLQVGAAAAAATEEDLLVLALSIFSDLLEGESSVTNGQLPQILQFALDAASATTLERESRYARTLSLPPCQGL